MNIIIRRNRIEEEEEEEEGVKRSRENCVGEMEGGERGVGVGEKGAAGGG